MAIVSKLKLITSELDDAPLFLCDNLSNSGEGGMSWDQLLDIVALVVSSYVTKPFEFKLVEPVLIQWNAQFKRFPELLLENISVAEMIFVRPEQRSNFYDFLIKLMGTDMFSRDEFMTRLSPTTLTEIKLIPSCCLFNYKLGFYSTALMFKQSDFDLLRESNAAYSRLLVQLEAAIVRQAPEVQVVELIYFNVGGFSLDLVRIVEFIIRLFELHVETLYKYFLAVLKAFLWAGQGNRISWVNLYSSILGTRFSNSLGETPRKLCHVAALMVKHNLVELDIFFIQLGPSLVVWEDLYSTHMSALSDRHHNIGMYQDPDRKSKRFKKVELLGTKHQGHSLIQKPKGLQRIDLLKALLSIGAYRDSMWILLRQQDFLGYDAECAKLYCRLILELFEFEPQHGLTSLASTNDKTKVYPVLDPLASGPNQRFYYSDWREEINEELVETRFGWMRLLGPNIRSDALFTRLVNMSKEPLMANRDSFQYRRWSEIIHSSLFPSLLINDENEKLHRILWKFLRDLSLEDRYCLYANWTFGHIGNSSLVNLLQRSTRMVVKSLTRRITSDNAPTLASLFRSEILRYPGMVFLEILKPVMRYGQFAQYTEIFCSLTELSVDVFHFVVSVLLKSPEHHGIVQPERLKDDCTSVTGWLRNLAHFNSLLCLKYDFFDINIAHVVSQLQEGNPYDLVFLSELLSNLGGLESQGRLTSLKHDIVFTPVPCLQSQSPHASARRLAVALANSGLFTALVVLLAQQQQSVIFSIDMTPCTSDAQNTPIKVSGLSSKFIQANKRALALPKVLANHIDIIHDVLLRLVELISMYISSEKLQDLMPSLTELCKGYGIDASLAFTLLRPWLKSLTAHNTQEVGSGVRPDVSLKESKSNIAPQQIWLPSLQPVILEFQELFPSATVSGVRSEFYVSFWQLQMDDVYAPSSQYKHKISQYKNMLRDERTYERREILIHHFKLFKQEYSSHFSLYNSCLERISREKKHWFAATIDPRTLATQLVENCILQRSPISRWDAMFCAKFLVILHREAASPFSLILVIDDILDHFKKMLFLFTEAEAHHFGTFLAEVFGHFTHWNANFTTFASEASSLISSSPPWTSHTASKLQGTYGHRGHDPLPRDIFRFQLLFWSNRILDIALQCLNSREYMQIHSTISVLAEMEEIFPITTDQYSALMESIQALIIVKKVNLCSLALSYKAKLIKIHPRCVPVATFASIPDPPFHQPPTDNEDEIIL